MFLNGLTVPLNHLLMPMGPNLSIYVIFIHSFIFDKTSFPFLTNPAKIAAKKFISNSASIRLSGSCSESADPGSCPAVTNLTKTNLNQGKQAWVGPLLKTLLSQFSSIYVGIRYPLHLMPNRFIQMLDRNVRNQCWMPHFG